MTTPANRPQARLRIGWPRVGSDAAGLGLTVPGSIVNYRYQMDSDELRTRTYAVGDLPENAHSDPDQPPPPRPVVIEERPNPLLPRLDAVDDWPGTILVAR